MKTTLCAKKVLSLILAIIMVSACIVSNTNKQDVSAEAANGYYAWGGYSSYLKGEGTGDNPFLISTPSDLAYFRKQVADTSGTITYYLNNNTANTAKTRKASTAFYKLTADIYYNDPNGEEWKTWSDTVTPSNGGASVHTWAPPGYDDVNTRNFEGVLDGAGHTIYGLYIVHPTLNSVGFIGTGRYGIIKNLTLADGYVHGNHQVGAFVGQLRWGFELVNCTSNMHVVGNNAVGGIAGGNAKNGSSINTDVTITSESTVSSATIYNCVNNGVVSGTKWVGGILGYISAGASRMQIEECVNNGAVSAPQCVGGILGGTRQVDGYGHSVIDSCVNYGDITAQTGGFTGGIVGCGRAVDIYYCQNYGIVCSQGNTVGGISGGSNSADALANGRIYYCYNAGAVTGTYYVGGIAGGGKSVNINQCANVATVTGTYDVGGILGRSGGTSDKRDTEVYDCYNTGSVVSTIAAETVAGIVGNIICEGTTTDNKYAKIKRCINAGEVTGGRAIAATESTLQNDAGTGLFVFTQFNATCFGLSGINTIFDGGNSVSSIVSDTVIESLGSAWDVSYPLPVLQKIDYSTQNLSGRAEMLSTSNVSVNANTSLEINVDINKSGFYNCISDKLLTYGIIAKKTGTFAGELKSNTNDVINLVGSLNGNTFVVELNGQTVDEYDDMFTIRPYVCFVENGHTVYIYGDCIESSYYTASGAENISAVNESVSFTCDEKMFLLAGGTDIIDCYFASSSDKSSITFLSSDTSVATVNKGLVFGVKAGNATITVTYTGAWGAVSRFCTVTVLDDLTFNVLANQFASQNGDMRIHTNELYRTTSITKNDGTVVDYNGTVFVVDGGNNNSKQLEYLIELRNMFLADGLASGMLSEAEYYRHLLSSKCQIQIVFLLTHWHTDHINGMRYHVSADKRVTVHKFYTMANPGNTAAAGYTSYVNGFNDLVTRLKVNSPNLVATQFSFEEQKIRYFSSYNTMSTTDTTLPVTLYTLTSRDWSKNSLLNVDETEWQNSSSTWFVIEYAGKKLLFTGDSYIMDTGDTYTGAVTSGNNSIDFMLYKHKNVVDTTISFMDCNHHGRAAYNENLFIATQPEIVLSNLYYGNESVALVNKAVTTADVYLGGDREQVFVLGNDGVFDTTGALAAYDKNTDGKAIRNRITLKESRGYCIEVIDTAQLTSPTGVTLPCEQLEIPLGSKVWLAPNVTGDENTDKNVEWEISDSSVITTDGAYITAHKVGVATISVKAGSYTDTCQVNVVTPKLALVSDSEYILGDELKNVGFEENAESVIKQFVNADVRITNHIGSIISESEIVGTGYNVSCYVDGNAVDSKTIVIRGDVNGDGALSSSDYINVGIHLQGVITLEDSFLQAADANENGSVESSDYLMITLKLKNTLEW